MKNRTGELREQFAMELAGIDGYAWSQLAENLQSIYRHNALMLVKACKEKGMAFVVDRELPENPYGDYAEKGKNEILQLQRSRVYSKACQDMLEAGYKPTEEIDIED